MRNLYDEHYHAEGEFIVVNIFPNGRWRWNAIQHLCWQFYMAAFQILSPLTYLPKLLICRIVFRHNSPMVFQLRDLILLAIRDRCVSSGTKPKLSWLWWTLYMLWGDTDSFEQDYLKAWKHRLERRGATIQVNIFLSGESLCVPILYDDSLEKAVGTDRETFEQLRMWYCWMTLRKGFGELLLPKRLVRIDRVGLCNAIENTVRLGRRKKTLELGRSAYSHVYHFENPSSIEENQRFQTEDIAAEIDTAGLEFVRTWDATAISVIAMTPFLISLVFGAVWTAVSIHYYGVNGQLATQTAFTVAAYIVTAGALLIALFAFLDSVSSARNDSP